MVNLHIVPLETDDTVAVVHPESGAFAFFDGREQVADLVSRNDVERPKYSPMKLDPNDPLYDEMVHVTEEFRRNAEIPLAEGLNTVIVKVTNRCNEACMHCYDAKGEVEADAEEEQLRNALGEAIALAGPVLHVLFHGGEPFLRLDMVERLAEFAKQRGAVLDKRISFYAQTNASIFSDRIVAVLKKYDFMLGISIDGWEELHDRLRIMHDGTGTYRLFKRSYDRHREYMTSVSGILTTVMATNVDLLPELVLHCRDMGFLTWETTLFDLNGRGALFPDMAVDPDKYCDSLMRIVDLIEAGELDNMAIKPILSRLDNLLNPAKLNMCLPGNGPCGAGSQLMSLSSNGEIFGCDIIHDKSLMLGELPAMTLSEAMATPPNLAVAERLEKNLTGCHGCTWLGVCGGTCLARSSLTTVNSVDCRISKVINPKLLSRLAAGNGLLEWYQRFPKHLRAAKALTRAKELATDDA